MNEKEEYQLRANIEAINSSLTRSQIGNSGKFIWTDDDVIGIFGYKSLNNRFHYVGSMEYDNVFSGIFDRSLDSIRFGYYPYMNGVVVKDDNLCFSLEEKTDFHNNVNSAPMIGFMSGNDIISFKQTGGLLYLSFKGFKADMSEVVVESSGETKHFLSGDAVVPINPRATQTFSFSSGSYKRRFDLSFIDKDTTVYGLFVPFQVGEYSTINVCIIDDSGDTVISNSLSDIIMERAKLIEAPLLDCSGEGNP